MNTPLRIEITDKAQMQISVASAWWAENRPAAPDAIREELDHILGLLCVQPEIGTISRRATLPGVRRVTLSRIRTKPLSDRRRTQSTLEIILKSCSNRPSGMKQQRSIASAGSGWICPTCRRQFARAKQWHSCSEYVVRRARLIRERSARHLRALCYAPYGG